VFGSNGRDEAGVKMTPEEMDDYEIEMAGRRSERQERGRMVLGLIIVLPVVLAVIALLVALGK
jgi:hypothetical protein